MIRGWPSDVKISLVSVVIISDCDVHEILGEQHCDQRDQMIPGRDL